MREITDIKEIQKISLDILKYIDKVCKENNIQYFLAGGTALGAVRHKGFIPWDDDIDLMMTRPNYEKFLEVMDKTEHPQYKALYCDEKFPNYFYGFTKVVDLSTELHEATYITCDQLGIFVDIFPIDGAPKNAEKIIKQYNRIKSLLNIASLKSFLPSTKGKLKNICKLIIYPFIKLFGWKLWHKKRVNLIKKCDFNKCEHSTIYEGMYKLKEIMPKSIYDDVIYVQFEDDKFPILKDYDKYLSSIYGDYMTPPPKEKQITHHDFKIYKKDTK